MAIYFDNAASTPLSPTVLQAMMPYLQQHHGNPSSIHQFGRKLKAALEESRRTVANLLNCHPAEIIFTSGGTEGDNFALIAAYEAYNIQHIISSPLEHHAVLHTLEYLNKKGVEIHFLKPDPQGNLDLNELEDYLKRFKNTMVSLMHANNVLGNLYPIEEIGALCERYGALFHSDTVQSIPSIRLDLEKIPMHFAVASAHKFNGPKGIGFLYKRADIKLSPLIHGGGQERGLRSGTENVASIVGLAKALEETYNHLEEKQKHLWQLKSTFIQQLQERVEGVHFNGVIEKGRSLPGTINVALPPIFDPPMWVYQLDIYGIAVSGGSACSSGSQKPSHVLQALGLPPEITFNSVRFSFGMQNTLEEIHYTINTIEQIIQQTKKISA